MDEMLIKVREDIDGMYEYYIECKELGNFDFTKIYTEKALNKIKKDYILFLGKCRCSIINEKIAKDYFSYEIRIGYLKDEIGKDKYEICSAIKTGGEREIYNKIKLLGILISDKVKHEINQIVIDEKMNQLSDVQLSNNFYKYIFREVISKYNDIPKKDLYKYEHLLSLIDLNKSMLYDIVKKYDVENIYKSFKSEIDEIYDEIEKGLLEEKLPYLEEIELKIDMTYRKVIKDMHSILNIPI